MSNETVPIRRIAFATAVFRSIVTANASGFTTKHRRQESPDDDQQEAVGSDMYGNLNYQSRSWRFSRDLLRR
jgi:hypothetical protein